jgi:hypothetical protein
VGNCYFRAAFSCMTRFMHPTCVVAALSLILIGTAAAQTQQNGDPKSCANSSASSGELSNKLSQSGGVICPPNVDPAMKAPSPNTGSMPVIPPPGSPGGNQNVQPK